MTSITDDMVLKAAQAQHPDVWSPHDGQPWPAVSPARVEMTLASVRRGLEAVQPFNTSATLKDRLFVIADELSSLAVEASVEQNRVEDSDYVQRVLAACEVLTTELPPGSYSAEGAAIGALHQLRTLKSKADIEAAHAVRMDAELTELRDVATRSNDRAERAEAELARIHAGEPGSISLETLGKLMHEAGLSRPNEPVDAAMGVLDGLVGAFYDAFSTRRPPRP